MNEIIIKQHNAVHYKVIAESGILREIQEVFSFYAPNYKHAPLYKMGKWDGIIKLFSLKDRLLYCGLLDELFEFCKNKNYHLDLSDLPLNSTNASDSAIDDFIKSLNVFELRDYQITAIKETIRHNNLFLLSPTNSGKTICSYVICRYYDHLKKLYIVPDTGLLNQTEQKFIEYGYDPEQIHTIFSGKEKQTDHKITISTWQSLMNMPEEYFKQWDLIIGDEAHKFQANKLKYIMENSVNAKHRIGMTGSLDGSVVNELTLRGLFGPIVKTTTTKELIDNNFATPLKINCIMLKYPKNDRDYFSPKFKRKYSDEVDFIINHDKRTDFIIDSIFNMKGNSLVLTKFIDKSLKPLYDKIKKRLEEQEDPRKIFLVYGNVKGEERIEIAKQISNENHSITIASSQTFSTGIDIPNIDNLFLISATKAPIPLLQSLGRILRIADNKKIAKVFDFYDDCSYVTRTGKKKKSYSLLHFIERLKIYSSEKHPYKIIEIDL